MDTGGASFSFNLGHLNYSSRVDELPLRVVHGKVLYWVEICKSEGYDVLECSKYGKNTIIVICLWLFFKQNVYFCWNLIIQRHVTRDFSGWVGVSPEQWI